MYLDRLQHLEEQMELQHLEEQIQEDYQLLKKYEDELRYAITLQEQLSYERKIKQISQKIKERKERINYLQSQTVEPLQEVDPKPTQITKPTD